VAHDSRPSRPTAAAAARARRRWACAARLATRQQARSRLLLAQLRTELRERRTCRRPRWRQVRRDCGRARCARSASASPSHANKPSLSPTTAFQCAADCLALPPAPPPLSLSAPVTPPAPAASLSDVQADLAALCEAAADADADAGDAVPVQRAALEELQRKARPRIACTRALAYVQRAARARRDSASTLRRRSRCAVLAAPKCSHACADAARARVCASLVHTRTAGVTAGCRLARRAAPHLGLCRLAPWRLHALLEQQRPRRTLLGGTLAHAHVCTCDGALA
jgi:hypothetical protein